jgi:hypothetical protein
MAAIVDLTFYRDGEPIKVGEVQISDDGTIDGSIWEGAIAALIPIASTPGMVELTISPLPAVPA